MNASHPSTSENDAVRRLARLEARVAQLEARAGLPADTEPTATSRAVAEPPSSVPSGDDLELKVGQDWFARIGIGVLALGAGFTLSLPYASLPAALPSLTGLGLAAGLFAVAWGWRDSFELVASYLRGVAMALLYFAILRLYFFSPRPLLTTGTFAGQAVLVFAVAINLIIAWRRRSPWLLALALLTGCLTAIAVGSTGFVLPVLGLLSALVVAFSARGGWPALWLAFMPVLYATYLAWALNDPLLGRPLQFIPAPAGPACVLLMAAVLASGPLWWRSPAADEGGGPAGALLNCALGYGVFLIHTLGGPGSGFATAHLAAAMVLFGLAVLFRLRAPGRVAPFLYAMTGNLALSVAILKLSTVPDVFVWLSLQSVLVVAAATWFRSRFMVVANFLIFALIVVGYVVMAARESGISLGFGIVALGSARILHWQKDRLELRTELMRNAYLLGAFVVFPYALLHLVPPGGVGFAWVGLALFYYLMNLIVRSPKFRWMGHATLLLTTGYLLMVGTSRLEPVYRVLSFLVLGTVLLGVSLLFTRLHRRPRSAPGS